MTVGSRCEGVDLLEQPDRKKNEQSEKMDENKEHSRGSDASEIKKTRKKPEECENTSTGLVVR